MRAAAESARSAARTTRAAAAAIRRRVRIRLGALGSLGRDRASLALGDRRFREAVLDDGILRGPHLVEPLHRPMMRRLLQQLGILRRLAGDREHRVAEGVERLLRLRLRRLDHQRLGDDEREVDRRRVEAVVHQPLGDVERGAAVLPLQAPRGHHELVHAEAVERQVVRLLQPREDVVRVEHSHLGHLAQPRPPHPHVGVRADEDAERAGEAAHLADRLRPVVVEAEAALLPAHDRRHGQERLQDVADGDRPTPGAATSVRLRERLVQVDVDDVEAHVAGPRDAAHGVEVRAVVVHERAGAVEDPLDLLDVLVEQAERRRVREHERRGVLVDLAAQVVDVDVPARVGLDVRQLVARHRDRGRIRAVRRVGHDDLATLFVLAAGGEVRAGKHEAGDLSLRARRRLERDGVEPRYLREDLLQPPHQLERALRPVVLLQRVETGEARERREPLVDARVVLHRAGAERVEARVHAEVAGRELGEMADELELGHLRQARRLAAAELLRELGGRRQVLVTRQRRRAPAGLRLLVDQLHRATSARTSARRSISSGVRRSVTATSRTSSIPS